MRPETDPDEGVPRVALARGTDPGDLTADCASCFGLCCVAPAFAASADFAVGKPAGQPCRNLQPDFRCGIHRELRAQGFRGCAVYDCFGAGQKVSRLTFGALDWQQAPATAGQMFEVFAVMRQLHELLWYLAEALTLPAARALHDKLRLWFDRTDQLTRGDAPALLGLHLAAHRDGVNALLLRASELVRAAVPRRPDHRGADLVGADLHAADLAGASLRGALLVGADLTDADLRLADLTGADLRGTDLRGADLTSSIFLTQAQLRAATGDARTALPAGRTRPAHWPA